MPVKRLIPYDCGHFFITFTCYKWLPLIKLTNGYDLIYNWFDHLKNNGHYITGYVIMPNHVHATIAFRSCGQSINTIVGNGKRFIGYEIIERLKNNIEDTVLQQLGCAVNSFNRRVELYPLGFGHEDDWEQSIWKAR